MKNTTLLYIIGGIVLIIIIFHKSINKKFFMFTSIIAKILQHEGGYVNDPDDAGGETNFGISKRSYPNLDIKNLTRSQASEIYKRDFYIPLQIDSFTDMNLAANYMDMAVNAGISNAKTIMNNAKDLQSKSGGNIAQIYQQLRIEYYKKVATYRNNSKYLAGWINRVNSSNIA